MASFTDNKKLFQCFLDYPTLFNLKIELKWEPGQLSRQLKNCYARLKREKTIEHTDEKDDIRRDNLLAFLAIKLEKYTEARNLIERVQKKDPENLVTLTNQGILLVKRERVAEARRVLKSIEELQDEKQHGKDTVKCRIIIAKAELAYSYSRFGPRYHKLALESFNQVLCEAKHCALSSEYIVMWNYGLSLVYARSLKEHNYSEDEDFNADRYYSEVVKLLYPTVTSCELPEFQGKGWVKLAEASIAYSFTPRKHRRMNIKLPDGLSTDDCFKKAEETAPGDHHVLDRIGRYMRQSLKDFDQAIEYLERSRDILPTGFTYHHLGLAYKDKWKQQNESRQRLETSNRYPRSGRPRRRHSYRGYPRGRGRGRGYYDQDINQSRGHARPQWQQRHSEAQSEHQYRRFENTYSRGSDVRISGSDVTGHINIQQRSEEYWVDHRYPRRGRSWHTGRSKPQQGHGRNRQNRRNSARNADTERSRSAYDEMTSGLNRLSLDGQAKASNQPESREECSGADWMDGRNDLSTRHHSSSMHQNWLPSHQSQGDQDQIPGDYYHRRKTQFSPKPRRKYFQMKKVENPVDPGNPYLLKAKEYFMKANDLTKGTFSYVLADIARTKLSLDEDFEDSVDYFRLALDLTYSHLEASMIYEQWGSCLIKNGQVEDGKNLLRKAIESAAKVKYHAKVAFPALEDMLKAETQRHAYDPRPVKELAQLYRLIEHYADSLELSEIAYHRDSSDKEIEELLIDNLNKHGGCNSRLLGILLKKNGFFITPEMMHTINREAVNEQSKIALSIPRDIFQDSFAEIFGLPSETFQYEYDIFVMHCQQDSEFAKQILLSVIEDCIGLECCFPDRDFDEEVDFVTQCENAAQKSCCIAVIVSRRFMCEYGDVLSVIAGKISERKNGQLVLCMIEDINLPDEMKVFPKVECSHLNDVDVSVADEEKWVRLAPIRDSLFEALTEISYRKSC